MKARVAVIRDDFTWTELIVKTDGANASNASQNAISNALEQLGYWETGKYPEHVIGLSILRIWERE